VQRVDRRRPSHETGACWCRDVHGRIVTPARRDVAAWDARRVVAARLRPGHRNEPTVAAAGQGLDVAWRGGIVAERVAQLLHGRADAQVELDDCIAAPEPRADGVRSDHFSDMLEQDHEEPERLVLQSNAAIVEVQLSGTDVERERAEARPTERLDRRRHAWTRTYHRLRTSSNKSCRQKDLNQPLYPRIVAGHPIVGNRAMSARQTRYRRTRSRHLRACLEIVDAPAGDMCPNGRAGRGVTARAAKSDGESKCGRQRKSVNRQCPPARGCRGRR
jgi:hypothetical protein